VHPPPADTVVLIPIRSFTDAKSRLADALDADERRRLSMWMAERVVRAAGTLPTRIVTDDAEVVSWSRTRRTGVLTVAARGLNPSVSAAVKRATDLGFARVIIAHADLPAATDFRMIDRPGVCIAPDRRRDGSNVMCVPTGVGFEFAYGPGSFERHCAEARRLRLALHIIDDDALAWDVDDPDDLPDDWRAIAATQEPR
jgi:2-phospho-L-lactate/phosphoenolpyruvate guanylyltransferase